MIVFQKHNEENKIMWVIDTDTIGNMFFSFDKIKIYNYYKDYPHNMTKKK